jgi:hypothetical protein
LNEQGSLGSQYFERRTISIERKGRRKPESWIITRPIPFRFSALTLTELEDIARSIYEHSQADWRQANIENCIVEARAYDRTQAIYNARHLLGPDATEQEIEEIADQMRLSAALVEGGDAAAAFFDEYVSVCNFDVGENGELEFRDIPPLPIDQPFDASEWDYYSPEEIAELGGPECDAAYAYRVMRLCEAIGANEKDALHLAVQLGAVTREWEIWRENEEFLHAGRNMFTMQRERSQSKTEKDWMKQVREDILNKRIGLNIAAYARKFVREHRNLDTPKAEAIRNFISRTRSGIASSQQDSTAQHNN